MNIDIGAFVDGGRAHIDIATLLKTRLLITANSGGGKSYLIRRFVEQAFGKIPILIIDPEGEFPSLREKFDFVLVGKGGETPAEIRSAEIVAHKLLELRASAIIDLYELKPQARHEYVSEFLKAVMNAPKKFWRPTIIVVDEAHKFAPERSSGESVASEDMIQLATAGRKRGFAAVWATQRLSKLRKDGSAEFLNRLVGQTFEDVDLDRVVDLLSVGREEKRQFLADMRVLQPGRFWAFGRAITKERKLVEVGSIQTSHQDVTSGKMIVEAPPPTEKVRALLPKLADLPKQAEEKARTEAELKAEIRSLKAQLRVIPKPGVDKTEVDRLVQKAVAEYQDEIKGRVILHVNNMREKIIGQVKDALKTPGAAEKLDLAFVPKRYKTLAEMNASMPVTRISAVAPVKSMVTYTSAIAELDRKLNRCERAVASFLHANAGRSWTRAQVAAMTGYALGSGGLNNAFGFLNAQGIIAVENGQVQAGEKTVAGLDLTAEYTVSNIESKLGRCEKEIWRVASSAPEKWWEVEELLSQTQNNQGQPYVAGSGGVNNAFGRLSTLEMIERRSGKVRVSAQIVELME